MPKKEIPKTGENQAKKRGPDGKFLPGNKSGGRKPIPDDVKKMLSDAAPDAVNLLIEVMKDAGKEDKLRVQCAETIIERVYGKNPQPIITDGEGILRVIFGNSNENIEDFSI